MNRWAVALVLLAVSVAISAALYLLGMQFFFLVLFLPLVPLLGRRRGEP